MNKKLLLSVLVLGRLLCASSASADQCSGTLKLEPPDQLVLSDPKREDICLVGKADMARVLGTCTLGRYCVVTGTVDLCEDSGECVQVTQITRVATKDGCYITREQFEALQLGMSYQQVIAEIGCAGELLSESNFGGLITKMYKWGGPNDVGAVTLVTQGNILRYAPQCAPGKLVPVSTSISRCTEYLPQRIVDTQKLTVKSQFGL